MSNHIILVDEQDNPRGTMEKLEAHQAGELHRAFSVFLWNSAGEMLIQQRALDKYHSGGLWSNACCSHQAPGEDTIEAGKRRLAEEIGLSVSELTTQGHHLYRVEFDNGLVEHEYDHIVVGVTDAEPVLNPSEAMAYRWIGPDELASELANHPERFTVWFREIMAKDLVGKSS